MNFIFILFCDIVTNMVTDIVKKLHDLIDQIAAATGHDSTDIFRVLLAKLIEKPEEQQTFDKLLEMAEKIVAKH